MCFAEVSKNLFVCLEALEVFLSFLKFLKPPERRFQTIFDNTSYCGEILQLFTLSTLWIQLFALLPCAHDLKKCREKRATGINNPDTIHRQGIQLEGGNMFDWSGRSNPLVTPSHLLHPSQEKSARDVSLAEVGSSCKISVKGLQNWEGLALRSILSVQFWGKSRNQKFPQKRWIQDVATVRHPRVPNLLQGYISCATGWANGDQGTSVGHVGEWSSDHFCTSFYAKLLISYDVFNHRSHIIILKYDRMGSTM